MPIVDSESGTVPINTVEGKDYIKVFDPVLNLTRWHLWQTPSGDESGSNVMTLLVPEQLLGGEGGGEGAEGAEEGGWILSRDPSADVTSGGDSLLLPKLGSLFSGNTRLPTTVIAPPTSTSHSDKTGSQEPKTTTISEDQSQQPPITTTTATFWSTTAATSGALQLHVLYWTWLIPISTVLMLSLPPS